MSSTMSIYNNEGNEVKVFVPEKEQEQIRQYFLNVVRINKKLYSIKTDYNEFQMVVDEVKGIGIYLMCPNGALIKTYKHTKVEMGLNWIIKNYTNFVK